MSYLLLVVCIELVMLEMLKVTLADWVHHLVASLRHHLLFDSLKSRTANDVCLSCRTMLLLLWCCLLSSSPLMQTGRDKNQQTPPRFHLLISLTLLRLSTLSPTTRHSFFLNWSDVCVRVASKQDTTLRTFIVCQQFAWVSGESQEVKYTSSCQDIATYK